MKRLIALILAATVFPVAAAHAAEADSLTITVRPNAYYAVEIDTGGLTSIDLGTVALGASTQTVHPATVTVQSTYASTDLRLKGGVTSTGFAWQFDDDTGTQEEDRLAAWATFTDVARSSAPPQSGGYFSGTQPGIAGSDVISAANNYVGTGGGTTDLFEANGEFGEKDMDGLPPDPDPDAKSHLWLRFRLPSATTDDDPQNITITITATAPN